MKKLFILLMTVLMLLTGCAKEAPAAVSDFQSPLSDDVETRFIQVFYQELNDPTIEKPDFTLNYVGMGDNSVPCHHFKETWFKEEGLMQGAFYFIEPPYSDTAMGLDRSVVRGIYDLRHSPIEKLDKDAEKSSFPVEYDSVYLGFSMDFVEENCSLHDLTLTYHQDGLDSQNIPLNVDGTHVEADFTQVPKLTGKVGGITDFSLSGILTYNGQDYPFKAQF